MHASRIMPRKARYLVTLLVLAGCGAQPGSQVAPEAEIRASALVTTAVGDANADGTVNIVDALVIAQYLNGTPPVSFDVDAADADCNGQVDMDDANLISEFVAGTLPDLVCPTYHGPQPFQPWYMPLGTYQTYSSQHYTLYSADVIKGRNAATFLANMEACYALQAKATPNWTSRVETQAPLGTSSKTIAFLRGTTCGSGCGNQYRVEAPDWIFADPNAIGNRLTMWVPYYEQQRAGGTPYDWYDYLFYNPANTDWNSAFAHSMAITCSEAIGTGTYHNNVTYVNSALPQWVNQGAHQKWVDILSTGTGKFVRQDGATQGINDLFGAMLAEMYRRFGVEYFNLLTQELLRPGAYPVVDSARTQACNFLRASDVVTNNASHDLLVTSWRFPSDCNAQLSAQMTVTSTWASGYCVEVAVKNLSNMATTTWKVVLDLQDASVYTSWSGTFSYIVKQMSVAPTFWNNVIDTGATTTFGFCANTSTGVKPTILGVSP
jgi:hypothetical protein